MRNLVDKESIAQVLGSVIKKPSIMEETGIELWREDFPELFHRIVYATVYNLYLDGVGQIDSIAIDSYLSKYPKQYATFSENNGIEYVETIIEQAVLENFEYNFNRVRKFTMLRRCKEIGIDTTEVYDDTILGQTEHEEMRAKFDSMELKDIANLLSSKFMEIEDEFLSDEKNTEQHAGLGMRDLKERLKMEPEYGSPLNGQIFNSILRGARRKKLYLRSAPTGIGKTRLSIGDSMHIGLSEMYNTETKEWEKIGVGEPVLFITTELEEDEVQTMMMAYASGVNEDIILDGSYRGDEEEMVDRAVQLIEESNIRIAYLPDFDIEEVERVIKKHIMNYGIRHIFFD